jgi:hypothetical protein
LRNTVNGCAIDCMQRGISDNPQVF